MQKLVLGVTVALVGFAGPPPPVSLAAGEPSRSSAVTFGLDSTGKPYCDPAATVKSETRNGDQQYVVCTWSCATIAGQRARWKVVFGRVGANAEWAVYLPDAVGSCAPLAPSGET